MPLHILIADDSATNRQLFSLVAARMGHRADTAASGREALALFAQHAYDLVFLDLAMPVMDGYTLARQMQIRNPHRIPLYAISGYVDEAVELRALAAGFQACLQKPLDRAKIFAAAETLGAGSAENMPRPPGAESESDIVPRLLPVYAQELRARAAACERYWKSGDMPALRREAHTLRALADMLNTAAVAAAASEVEKMQSANIAPDLGQDAADAGESAGRKLRRLCAVCLRAAASIERAAIPRA